jgi:hypothetical protein
MVHAWVLKTSDNRETPAMSRSLAWSSFKNIAPAHKKNPWWTCMDDSLARLQQVSEVNCDQEWEIQDIIGKEVVNSVVHY